MILTLCRLGLGDRLARAESRDLASLHLRVVDAAQGIPPPEGGRLLWSHPRPGILLVQTGGPVSRLGFPRGYLAEEPTHLDVSARLRDAGPVVRFGLVANPVKSAPKEPKGEDGRRRTRGPHRPLPLAERDAWLRRRLAGALEVTDLQGEPAGCRVGRKTDGVMISYTHHAWSGTARVCDRDALGALVRAGIGSGKAYGLGLLVIR